MNDAPALLVLAPGLHSTVQDLGRPGFQDAGVPVSGALDSEALRLANALVGNPPGTACLEILYQGPSFEVAAESVRIALAGSEAELEILGGGRRSVPAWRSLRLERGQAFRVVSPPEAASCYLAIEGGLAVEPWLGSLATFVRGAMGGFHGRALRQGDRLPLALAAAEERDEMTLPDPPEPGFERPIRVVLGPQQGYFTEAAIARFLEAEYAVSKSADRMGARLDGPTLAHRESYNIVSDGIATGAVQVPGSGQPIILLADHQTTGGYPKLAAVISADLPLLGRRRVGAGLRFQAVSVAEAEALRREGEARLRARLDAIAPAPPLTWLDLDSLYSGNLISGVVSGHE
jgi:allophanate hydrolase